MRNPARQRSHALQLLSEDRLVLGALNFGNIFDHGKPVERFAIGTVNDGFRKIDPDDFAGLLDVEKALVERCQMAKEIAAQIRDDPLAERHDEIIAHAGGDREHADDADQEDEVDMDFGGGAAMTPRR